MLYPRNPESTFLSYVPLEQEATKAVDKAVAKHLRDDDSEDVQVTWEDQQRINRFNRLIGRLQDLKSDLAAAKVCTRASPKVA